MCEIGEDVESGPRSPDTAGVGGLERREEGGQTGGPGEVVTATPTRKRVKVCPSIQLTHNSSDIYQYRRQPVSLDLLERRFVAVQSSVLAMKRWQGESPVGKNHFNIYTCTFITAK